MHRITWLMVAALVLLGCGDDGGTTDSGATDSGATDSGATDSAATDSAASDTGVADGSRPDANACAASGTMCDDLPCCEGSACDPATRTCAAGLECIELENDCGAEGTPCCGPGICVATGGAGFFMCRDERGCIPGGATCGADDECCASFLCSDGTCLGAP